MADARVVVAMSGGVDSSVAAALLKEQGYDVIGVTMHTWPEYGEEIEIREGGCCSVSATRDARRVCEVLGIPYYVLNFRAVFERNVISRFAAEYAAGRTPNPCIACNRYVKFEPLLRKAMELEADFLATGHYARTGLDAVSGRHLLLRAVDERKDQTYALYGLTQPQLAMTMFPLGELRKPQVRELARRFGLPTADKAESQEICFVVDGDYAEYLQSRIPEAFAAGPIVDTAGRRLGTHRGLPRYTVGQRRGLGVSAGRPLYVVRLEAETNTLVVGEAEEVLSAGFIASDPNWIAIAALDEERACTVKIRYGAQDVPVRIRPLPGGGVEGRFDEPQRAVTPGQAAVFYDGERVLGGATIASPLPLSR